MRCIILAREMQNIAQVVEILEVLSLPGSTRGSASPHHPLTDANRQRRRALSRWVSMRTPVTHCDDVTANGSRTIATALAIALVSTTASACDDIERVAEQTFEPVTAGVLTVATTLPSPGFWETASSCPVASVSVTERAAEGLGLVATRQTVS